MGTAAASTDRQVAPARLPRVQKVMSRRSGSRAANVSTAVAARSMALSAMPVSSIVATTAWPEADATR